MPRLTVLATHLPAWGTDRRRTPGSDEDALTLAVAAGRAALEPGTAPVTTVLLVTRDVPALLGGVEPVLLAALGLDEGARCAVVLGGAPAALDAVAEAAPGTLVIAVDVEPAAAAAAAVLGADSRAGADVAPLRRAERSLPTRVRDAQGGVHDYDDPRLVRVRGTGAGIARLQLQDKPLAVAGVSAKDAAAMVQGTAAALPSDGAAAALFALADVVARSGTGAVVAVEQGTATAVDLGAGAVRLVVHAPAALPVPTTRLAAGGDIKISIPAYERAFDSKLGLQAGACSACGTLALPPRYRCLECGCEDPHGLVPLPRRAAVYTAVTVHVPVPGLRSPYDLVIVELGDTGVRLLTTVTDRPAGEIGIGDSGTLVLRRLAVRAGIPDYGYAFQPDQVQADATHEGAA